MQLSRGAVLKQGDSRIRCAHRNNGPRDYFTDAKL